MKMTNKKTKVEKITRRRTLVKWLWGVVAIGAVVEGSWLVTTLLKSHRRKEAKSQKGKIIDAGLVSDFKPGQVKAVPQGQFYLSCLEDGSFIALSKTCTHLGCSVPYNSEENTFICPCHGSSFDKKGLVLTAPAIRPLDYYLVRVENGRIRVNISSPVKRQSFDDSQAARV